MPITEEQWKAIYAPAKVVMEKMANRLDIDEHNLKIYRVGDIVRIDIKDTK